MPPPPKTGIPALLLPAGIGGDLFRIVQRGPAHPERTFAELLPLARQLQEPLRKAAFIAQVAAVESSVDQRWGDTRLGEFSIADLVAWLEGLRHPSTGKGMAVGVRSRLTSLLWLSLFADAVEAAVGEPPELVIPGLIPVWTAAGAGSFGGGAAGLGIAIGNLLGRKSGTHGHSTAIARSVPGEKATGFWITRNHLVLMAQGGENLRSGGVFWHCARTEIRGIRLRRHVQLLRRFDLCFDDDSTCSYFYTGKRRGPRLKAELGSA